MAVPRSVESKLPYESPTEGQKSAAETEVKKNPLFMDLDEIGKMPDMEQIKTLDLVINKRSGIKVHTKEGETKSWPEGDEGLEWKKRLEDLESRNKDNPEYKAYAAEKAERERKSMEREAALKEKMAEIRAKAMVAMAKEKPKEETDFVVMGAEEKRQAAEKLQKSGKPKNLLQRLFGPK
jgi:hypothetical protein